MAASIETFKADKSKGSGTGPVVAEEDGGKSGT
jgi:hypothetical protein